MLKLVGNDKCSPCLKAKKLLVEAGVEYVEMDRWDVEIRVLFKLNQVRNIPAIFDGDDYIGGLAELEAWLAKKGK